VAVETTPNHYSTIVVFTKSDNRDHRVTIAIGSTNEIRFGFFRGRSLRKKLQSDLSGAHEIVLS
jgi:hypothetical protein